MIVSLPAPLLRAWKAFQYQSQRWHTTVIYLLRPLYIIRYTCLLFFGVTFILRYLLVIKSTLPIFQFIVFLLTVWIGECMKARYSAIYELRPLLIDRPWSDLNRAVTDKYVLYEADIWLKLFVSNLLAVILSFTEIGKRGVRLLPFVLSLMLDLIIQVVRPYRKFRIMGYNKGILLCIVESCRHMNWALKHRF